MTDGNELVVQGFVSGSQYMTEDETYKPLGGDGVAFVVGHSFLKMVPATAFKAKDAKATRVEEKQYFNASSWEPSVVQGFKTGAFKKGQDVQARGHIEVVKKGEKTFFNFKVTELTPR